MPAHNATQRASKPAVVLVADDDPVMRLLMVEMLDSVSLDAIEAEDGAQAVQLARERSPDLILMDVDMPHMDGFAACRAIRDAANGASVPIVMVTGGDDLEAVTNAYEAGATDFVSKPINWPILGHRVLYVLRASDAIVRLRIADAQNRAVLAAIPDTFFRMSREGIYLDYEPGRDHPGRASRGQQAHGYLHAYPVDDCVGKHVAEVLPPEIAERMLEQVELALRVQQVRSVEYELIRFGEAQHFEARLVATGSAEVLGLVRDISERKRAEEQIRRLAYCDSLTGIPNRQAFLEMLERELQRSKIGNKKFAVLFMDLDAFKRINDTLGHNVGDQLLQQVSERLRETIRPSDLLSRAELVTRAAPLNSTGTNEGTNLARLGGDEFTILIPDLERVEHALNVAHRVKDAMRRPFLIEGHEIFVTASIGISLFPEDGDDCTSLLKFADTAMYHAKTCGKNNAKLYSSSLTMQIMSHVKLEVGLRRALQNDELYLLYQPQLDVRSNEIVGVEALVRWRHA
ncbi:MAG: diguanylate cyclase, partial [Oxalobacteraceae bacterium]